MQQEGKQQQPRKAFESAAHQFFANLPSSNSANLPSSNNANLPSRHSSRASSSRQKLPPPAASHRSSTSFSSPSKDKGKGKAKSPVWVVDLTQDEDIAPRRSWKQPTKPVERGVIDLSISSSEDERDFADNASSDSSIVGISSTMVSKKGKDPQRGRARDKANGLVQARLSIKKDENVKRYATVSPTKKSLPPPPELARGPIPMHSGGPIQVKRKSLTPKMGGPAVASGSGTVRPQLGGSSSFADNVEGEVPSMPQKSLRRPTTPTSPSFSLSAPRKPPISFPPSPTIAMRGKVVHRSSRFRTSPVKRERPRSPHNTLQTKARTTIRSPGGISTAPSLKHGESSTPSQHAAQPTPTTSSTAMPVSPLPRHDSNPVGICDPPAAQTKSPLSLRRVNANVSEDQDEAYKPPANWRQEHAPAAGRTPGRSRPLPGAYALPTVDTPILEWPTFQGSPGSSGTTGKRREKGKGKEVVAEGSAGASSSVETEIKGKSQAKELAAGEHVAPTAPEPIVTFDVTPDTPFTPPSRRSESNLTSLSGCSVPSACSLLRRSTASSRSTLAQLSATPTKSVDKAPVAAASRARSKRGPKLSPESPERKKRGQMQVIVEIPVLRREYTPLMLSPTKREGRRKGKGKLVEQLVEVEEEEEEGEEEDVVVVEEEEVVEEVVVEEQPTPKPRLAETDKEQNPNEDAWEEMDLEAWDDFDWAAPAPAADGPSTTTSFTRTASRSGTPSQSGLVSPSRRPLATTGSGSAAATPCRSLKRALSTSPSTSAKRTKSVDVYQKLVEEEKQKWAKAQEEAAAKRAEERRKEAEAEAAHAELMASDDEEDENEEDMLGHLLANIKSPVKPNSGLRVSSRNAYAQESRKAKAEEKCEAKRQREAKASEAKRHAASMREFNALGKEMAQNVAALELLRDVDVKDDLVDDGAYPTPAGSESVDDDEMSDYGDEVYGEFGSVKQEREPILGVVVEKMKANGIEIDEGLVRDATMGKEKPTDELRWEGFWEKDFEEAKAAWMVGDEGPLLQVETDDTIVSLLKSYTSAGDTASLSALVSSGALDLIDSSSSGAIASWLYDYALASPDYQWAEIATTALIHFFESGKVPLNTVSLNQQIPSVLLYMGARSSIFLGFKGVDVRIPQLQNRETVCILVCRILKAGLKHHVDDSPVSHLLLPILLLLAIDPTTSKTLRRHIDEAVTLLLAKDVKPGSPLAARAVAERIAKCTKPYGEDVWSAVLLVLGETTQPARDVNRWLGMAYFWGGSLASLDNLANPPPIPSVPLVLTSLVPVFNSLKGPPPVEETDWKHFNHLITFLYSALSDIDMLVDLDPPKFGADKSVDDLCEEHPVEDIRALLRQMLETISDQSDGTHKSLVKGRLHQLVTIIRLVLNIAIRKRSLSRPVGANLKQGERGQARLNFGKKPASVAGVREEQAEPSSEDTVGVEESSVVDDEESNVAVNDLV